LIFRNLQNGGKMKNREDAMIRIIKTASFVFLLFLAWPVQTPVMACQMVGEVLRIDMSGSPWVPWSKSFSSCEECEAAISQGDAHYFRNLHCEGGSSSSGGSSGYSSDTQMMEAILTPVFDKFFKWVFSDDSAQNQQQQTQQQKEEQEQQRKIAEQEYEKRQQEFKAKVQEQLINAKDEYQKQKQGQYQEQLKTTVTDFKNRFAVSEATKAVKLANCGAYNSLATTYTALQSIGGSKDYDGTMENLRKSAEFRSGNSNECPPIKIDIPEVSAAQPVAFQQQFYVYIEHQSDGIKATLDSLKEKKAKNDEVIVEKKQKVEEIKQVIEKQKNEKKQNDAVKKDDSDQLIRDALKELEMADNELQTAEDEDKKIKSEIEVKEKNVLALEQMRKTYDTDNKETTPAQQSKK
jgi:hypothetical protein